MKLGAQFFTLREKNKTPEGLYGSFKEMKRIGYQVVQMSAICAIEAERLKSFSDEFDLPIYQLLSQVLHISLHVLLRHVRFLL